MNRFRAFLSILFFIPQLAFSQETELIYLSGTDSDYTVPWDFYCTEGKNSGSWTTIPVPSNWEMQGFGSYSYGLEWYGDRDDLGKEKGLYKHAFQVPREWKGKKVNIVFDGSMIDTRVKINGKTAGPVHQGGFTRFTYPISKLLKYGRDNLLEVEVDKVSANESVNMAEKCGDYWSFGGIYRPVFLEALPEVHMKRIALDPQADGTYHVRVELSKELSDCSIEIELRDMTGKRIGDVHVFESGNKIDLIEISGEFRGIEAWNHENPVLYDMSFRLLKDNEILHERRERVGFRTIELREHDGFYLNGEKIIFKGVNRHSFWPETGRCLSEENLLTDIRLIKEMNMNAVRCSHYVPDKRFLELCDSLGLLVLDEVTGWQQGYDTVVGPRLIREVVLRDENHPCVVIWDHGNEGGWEFSSERVFHELDMQERPVIYPWLIRNGFDTHHYPVFDHAVGRSIYGNDPFMATELLHGLYDGGHGAGLEAYWRSYESSPLFAGGFLWVLSDEAILRTDSVVAFFDAFGDKAPDGILGPHREKEGSFYTIKEIWSPVQVEPVVINKRWDGRLFLKNKHIYTDLSECSFMWSCLKTGKVNNREEVVARAYVKDIQAGPGETTGIRINCGEALQEADVFTFTALGPGEEELFTWAWPVIQPREKAEEFLASKTREESDITVTESSEEITATAGQMSISFGKKDGNLQRVENSEGIISLTGGAQLQGIELLPQELRWFMDEEGNFRLQLSYQNSHAGLNWILHRNGMLGLEVRLLEADKQFIRLKDLDFLGISFHYPEEKCTGVRWMGKGPYRVWKNRMKGTTFGIWEKQYNNTITGQSFNELIYPEFKGYHASLYWMKLLTKETPFTIISETPNLFFQLFTPENPEYCRGGVCPPFPDADLSFLYEIPAIGTKFKKAEDLGPGSQKGMYAGHPGDEMYPIRLWFDFNEK